MEVNLFSSERKDATDDDTRRDIYYDTMMTVSPREISTMTPDDSLTRRGNTTPQYRTTQLFCLIFINKP